MVSFLLGLAIGVFCGVGVTCKIMGPALRRELMAYIESKYSIP